MCSHRSRVHVVLPLDLHGHRHFQLMIAPAPPLCRPICIAFAWGWSNPRHLRFVFHPKMQVQQGCVPHATCILGTKCSSRPRCSPHPILLVSPSRCRCHLIAGVEVKVLIAGVAGIQLLVAVHLMMLLIWVRSGRYGTHLAGLAAVAIHVERLFVLNPTNKTD